MKAFLRETWRVAKAGLKRGFRMAVTAVTFFAIVAVLGKWAGAFAMMIEPI